MKLKMNGDLLTCFARTLNDLHYSLLEELLIISLRSDKVYPHELD